MASYPVHVAFPGRLIMVGFGSIGQGVLPLILRHVGIKPDQITIVTADDAGAQVAQEYGVRFVQAPADAREFQERARPAGRAWRLPAEPLGRRVLDRAGQALLGKGLAVPRHLHRAVAGRLHRPDDLSVAAHELRAARGGARAARQQAPADRRADARREPGPRLAFRQAGAGQHRERHGPTSTRSRTRRAEWAALAQQARRQGHPHRRARHAGRRRTSEAVRRVRQHVVGGRLRRAKAASPPSSAGARTRRTGRATARSTTSAAAARST